MKQNKFKKSKEEMKRNQMRKDKKSENKTR